ncbi:hypothetical protein H6771_02085 [Candidatus Peribacteria bacterium]|nr:hypothetical protein [Candidatus Peribacteria bacterium]
MKTLRTAAITLSLLAATALVVPYAQGAFLHSSLFFSQEDTEDQSLFSGLVSRMCEPVFAYHLDKQRTYPALTKEDFTIAYDGMPLFEQDPKQDLLDWDVNVQTYHTAVNCAFEHAMHDAAAYIRTAPEYGAKAVYESRDDSAEAALWEVDDSIPIKIEDDSYPGLPIESLSGSNGADVANEPYYIWEQEDIPQPPAHCDAYTPDKLQQLQSNLQGQYGTPHTGEWYALPGGETHPQYHLYHQSFAPQQMTQLMLEGLWCPYNLYLSAMENNSRTFFDTYEFLWPADTDGGQLDTDIRSANMTRRYRDLWQRRYREERAKAWESLKTMLHYYQQYVEDYDQYAVERSVADGLILVRDQWQKIQDNVEAWKAKFSKLTANGCPQDGNACQ